MHHIGIERLRTPPESSTRGDRETDLRIAGCCDGAKQRRMKHLDLVPQRLEFGNDRLPAAHHPIHLGPPRIGGEQDSDRIGPHRILSQVEPP